MVKQLPYQQWLTAFIMVARHYRLDFSDENVKVALEWQNKNNKDKTLNLIAHQLGMSLRFQPFTADAIDPWRLPFVVELGEGKVGVITKANKHAMVTLYMTDDEGLSLDLSIDELQQRIKRIIILRPESTVADARVDDYIKPYTENWFWKSVIHGWRDYAEVILASFFANLLALSAVLFSMQIYDRVIPAQSHATLWALFIGVLLAVVFEFLLRTSRTHISDVIGKQVDLDISDKVYGRALRLRNDVRPTSTGSFISQLRELDQLRELVTSTTVNALVDLPFVLVFLVILFMIGGPLAYVAVAALPLLILPGLLLQKPLSKLARLGMRESAIRNAIIIETVEAVEEIKLLRAENRFQNQWNQSNNVQASISIKQRKLVSFLLTWTQEIQTLVYSTILLVGAFLVIKGDITTGTLVGSSILASRMTGPLSQWSAILSRLQQAKIAYQGITKLMQLPIDQPANSKSLHRPVLFGHYELGSILLQYSKKDKVPALDISSLNINAGERVGILGRMGAGKSTLLHLLSGMARPQQGAVLLDKTNLFQLDQADVRRDVSFLSQNARLFFGSIRENLIMGHPLATDEEIIQVLQITGALPIVQQHQGLDYMLKEGGIGLSGGQKQVLLLARTLLKRANILLLDEPTAAMDDLTEHHVVQSLSQWLNQQTLIIATHRPAILTLVDRIIVIDNGKIILDGAKHTILSKLSAQSNPAF